MALCGGERGPAGGPVHHWLGHCSDRTGPERADSWTDSPRTNGPRVLLARTDGGRGWHRWADPEYEHLSEPSLKSVLSAGRQRREGLSKGSTGMVGIPSAASVLDNIMLSQDSLN